MAKFEKFVRFLETHNLIHRRGGGDGSSNERRKNGTKKGNWYTGYENPTHTECVVVLYILTFQQVSFFTLKLAFGFQAFSWVEFFSFSCTFSLSLFCLSLYLFPANTGKLFWHQISWNFNYEIKILKQFRIDFRKFSKFYAFYLLKITQKLRTILIVGKNSYPSNQVYDFFSLYFGWIVECKVSVGFIRRLRKWTTFRLELNFFLNFRINEYWIIYLR